MRTRMSDRVRGRGLDAPSYSIVDPERYPLALIFGGATLR